MTAAERFVMRMMGGISSSSSGNNQGNNTKTDIAEHDKKYHPDGYNPETDECKLRDNEADKVDADIIVNETSEGLTNNKEENTEVQPQKSVSETLKEIMASRKGSELIRKHEEKKDKREKLKEEVDEYLENGGELEIKVSGRTSSEEEESEEDRRREEYEKKEQENIDKAKLELEELESRIIPILKSVRGIKDSNSVIEAVYGDSKYRKYFTDKGALIIGEGASYFPRAYTEKLLRRFFSPRSNPYGTYVDLLAMNQIASMVKDNPNVRKEALDVLEHAKEIQAMFRIREGIKEAEEAKVTRANRYEKEKIHQKEKEEQHKREVERQAKKEKEYQALRVKKGIQDSKEGATELGIPEWMYSLINNVNLPKQRVEKEKKAEDIKEGNGVYIDLDRDSILTGDIIFGDCDRWYNALGMMRNYRYRPKNAYMYSRTGTRTHTMGFQGFGPHILVKGDTVTLWLTPHNMVTDKYGDTTDSENTFVDVLRKCGIDARLGTNRRIDIKIGSNGEPMYAKAIPHREFTNPEELISEEDTRKIANRDMQEPESPYVFIDSVYRGGGEEYPEAAQKIMMTGLIPLTEKYQEQKARWLVDATKGVMRRFPLFSRIMRELVANPVEFADGYIAGEIVDAKTKEGTSLPTYLRYSGARKSEIGKPMPLENHEWRPPISSSGYSTDENEARESYLIHELGHSYYNREDNKQKWREALIESENLTNKETWNPSVNEKVDVYLFPWVKKVSEYGKTNIDELHSECIVMCSLPKYKRGILPKPIEDYCFAVLNGEL